MRTIDTKAAGGPAGARVPVTDGEVTFTLLGPVEILKDGVDHAPTAPKVLQLMSLLLLAPGRVVPASMIVDELWGERPPRSVRTTMQTYVYHLRRCIELNSLADDAEQMLGTRPPGYVLRITPEQVDVSQFAHHHREGQELLAAGRNTEAASVLRTALDLWSGPPLANVACGDVLARHCVTLTEQRRHARHLWTEAEIASGGHRGLVAELRSLAATDRLDEELHGQLITVLARSGRRSEAMSTYHELRSRLVDELGIEPSDALRSLHHELLSDAV
ncbi:MAG: hypothetical protein AVDCRST_MAG66-2342 [uncultured Pseudonocardia sp.]|uniref:OmpR/PhoB-type domain-containing protein n=1 Tax=uncultured Pseudonocardia sp. TaxID=211455 RepID=A0A6J4PIF4_9PSEU|nr:MAG: hypothetical protein AVDCRST_MAG66-2342 [uncultured Pseudonocardia sp.]